MCTNLPDCVPFFTMKAVPGPLELIGHSHCTWWGETSGESRHLCRGMTDERRVWRLISDEGEKLAYGSWGAGSPQPMTAHPTMSSHSTDSCLWWRICAGKTHFFSLSGIQTVDVWNENGSTNVNGEFKAADRFILVRIAQQGYSLTSWKYRHIQKSMMENKSPECMSDWEGFRFSG